MKITELLFATFVASFADTALGWDAQRTPLIGTGVLTCFAALPFTGLSVNVSSTDDLHPLNRTILRVKAGVDAGKAILDAVASRESSSFFGKVGSIAKNIAPFLGAIGSIFGFLDLFLPKGPSPELQYMIKQFKEVNDRFDQVFAGLDDVKELIIKEAVREQYGRYTGQVSALSELLSHVIDAKANNLSNATIEGRKEAFLDEYGKVALYTGLQTLYLGMTEKANLLLHIPTSVRKYTDDDRVMTQNMMKGVLSVILKGVKVILAYYQLKGDETGYQDAKTEWTTKIQEITTHIQAVDKEVKDRWAEQLVLDVDKILTQQKDLSNKDFADHLYTFLTSKYDWRDWYVIVYDPVSGDDMHYFTNKNAFTWMDVRGRNVIITSEPKEEGLLDDHFVRSNIEQIPSGRWVRHPFFWGHQNTFEIYNARELFNFMQEKIGTPSCPWYRDLGSGVIKRSADPHYRAPAGKYAVIGRSQYVYHVFGHCFTPGSGGQPMDFLDDYDIDD